MGGRAIPQGYDSKADWSLGITSQMRKNEKSKSPGYPGNQVFKKLSELKAQEQSIINFKPLPSMQVTAEDISDYVQTLDTEKANVEIDTSKAAATSQFMSNYNDNQLYEVSSGNENTIIDLNQNLTDEILNTDLESLRESSGVALADAKKEAEKNGEVAGEETSA